MQTFKWLSVYSLLIAGCSNFGIDTIRYNTTIVELEGEERQKAIQLVLDTLLDPYSAKVERVYSYKNYEGATETCVWVNAKNRMGGYVGLQPSLILPNGVVWVAYKDHYKEYVHDLCSQVLKGFQERYVKRNK